MNDTRNRISRIQSVLCMILSFSLLICPLRVHATDDGTGQAAEVSWPQAPAVTGEAGIVMEVSTGAVLFEKNMHGVYYPASITKIMTALLAVENCQMNEVVTVPPEAVYMEDKGTHIALDVGEQLTVEQCLYAVMLASANDAAYALAVHVGGTLDGFVEMMNEKARELGCQDTVFTNPHGLPDESHVTSAYDMALITKAALEYEAFRTVSAASYYEIPSMPWQKDLICMYNHHKMISKSDYHNSEVFAGKTGYTIVSGHTLVTCAQRDGMEIICVVMKDVKDQLYVDTENLLAYGLDHFSKVKIEEDTRYYEDLLQKEDSLFDHCHVSLPEDDNLFVVLPKGADPSELKPEIAYEENSEHVTVTWYWDEHSVGKTEIRVSGIGGESETQEELSGTEEAKEPDEEKKPFPWKYLLYGGIGIALAACIAWGIVLIRRRSPQSHRQRWEQLERRKYARRVSRRRRRRRGRRWFR